MEVAKIVADILQTYGGWGMTTILIIGIVILHRNMGKLLEERHNQFINLLQESTSTMQQANDQMNRNEKLMNRIEAKLDSSGG